MVGPISAHSQQGVILAVDDSPTDLRLLSTILRRGGYTPVEASNGQMALELLESANPMPELVLADLHMPLLGGFEFLSIVKSNQRWQHIPVLLLTGEDSAQEESRGLDQGAADFIQKPVRTKVLLSRVKVHLEAGRQREHLEELARSRAEALIHADRMATLGQLSAGVAHEINNPTTFISGNIATLERFWQVVEPLLPVDSNPQAAFIRNEMPGVLTGMRNGVDRIVRIVSGLKTFARKSPGEHRPASLQPIVEEAMNLCNNSLKRIHVDTYFETPSPYVNCDPQQLEQIVANLLTNAADALDGNHNPQIRVEIQSMGSQAFIKISDNGPGIPAEILRKIWDPFFTTKPIGKGTGLGLSISQGIAESHGGSLSALNSPDGGATFLLTLPTCEAP